MTQAEREVAQNIQQAFDDAGLTPGQQLAIHVFMGIGKWVPDDVELPPWLERYREFERKINRRTTHDVASN